MDKISYSKWIDDVKQMWDVGDLVTLKDISYTPHCLPLYYRITYIDELCHNVPYDAKTNEPMALTCRTSTNIHVCKAPSTMRLLNKEEVELVTLSNKKPVGTC